MSKKKICSRCGKLVDYNASCLCYNKYKRDYYEINKESIKLLNTKRWKKLRSFIIYRDLGHCQRCFIKYNRINSEKLQVHHIKSRTDFPELTFEATNLITVCKTCNLELGTRNKLDFEFNPDAEKNEDYRL